MTTQSPIGTPTSDPGTKRSTAFHRMSCQLRSACRTETRKPRIVMSGAVVVIGSTNASSGVATTPEPNPATPRTA